MGRLAALVSIVLLARQLVTPGASHAANVPGGAVNGLQLTHKTPAALHGRFLSESDGGEVSFWSSPSNLSIADGRQIILQMSKHCVAVRLFSAAQRRSRAFAVAATERARDGCHDGSVAWSAFTLAGGGSTVLFLGRVANAPRSLAQQGEAAAATWLRDMLQHDRARAEAHEPLKEFFHAHRRSFMRVSEAVQAIYAQHGITGSEYGSAVPLCVDDRAPAVLLLSPVVV